MKEIEFMRKTIIDLQERVRQLEAEVRTLRAQQAMPAPIYIPAPVIIPTHPLYPRNPWETICSSDDSFGCGLDDLVNAGAASLAGLQ